MMMVKMMIATLMMMMMMRMMLIMMMKMKTVTFLLPPGYLWGPSQGSLASWFHKTDAPDKPEKGGHRDVNDKGEDEDKYRQIQDKYKTNT